MIEYNMKRIILVVLLALVGVSAFCIPMLGEYKHNGVVFFEDKFQPSGEVITLYTIYNFDMKEYGVVIDFDNDYTDMKYARMLDLREKGNKNAWAFELDTYYEFSYNEKYDIFTLYRFDPDGTIIFEFARTIIY